MQGTMPMLGASGEIRVTAGPEVCPRTATGLAGVRRTLANQESPAIYQEKPVAQNARPFWRSSIFGDIRSNSAIFGQFPEIK
jgi:hypothetical protein